MGGGWGGGGGAHHVNRVSPVVVTKTPCATANRCARRAGKALLQAHHARSHAHHAHTAACARTHSPCPPQRLEVVRVVHHKHLSRGWHFSAQQRRARSSGGARNVSSHLRDDTACTERFNQLRCSSWRAMRTSEPALKYQACPVGGTHTHPCALTRTLQAHVPTRTDTHTRPHQHVHTNVHKRTHARTHTHTHAHTRTHTHTRVPEHARDADVRADRHRVQQVLGEHHALRAHDATTYTHVSVLHASAAAPSAGAVVLHHGCRAGRTRLCGRKPVRTHAPGERGPVVVHERHQHPVLQRHLHRPGPARCPCDARRGKARVQA